MYRNLRIICTILSAICLAVIMPVTTWLGWTWAGVCLLTALLFFGLMLLFKQAQEKQENPDGVSNLSDETQTNGETNDTDTITEKTDEKIENTTDTEK